MIGHPLGQKLSCSVSHQSPNSSSSICFLFPSSTASTFLSPRTPLISRQQSPNWPVSLSFSYTVHSLVSAGSPRPPQSWPRGKLSKGSSLPSEGLTRPPRYGSLPPASHASSPMSCAHTWSYSFFPEHSRPIRASVPLSMLFRLHTPPPLHTL